MELLTLTYYGNSVQTWILALAVALVALVVMLFTKRLIVRQLRRLADRTSNELDDFAAAVLSQTKAFFLVALAVLAGAQALILPFTVTIFTVYYFDLRARREGHDLFRELDAESPRVGA